MSAPTVRWGVRITLGDERVRVTENHKPLAGTFQEALDAMAVFHEREPRLVKLTRKTKPKVVTKKVFTYMEGVGWECDGKPDFKGSVTGAIDDFLTAKYRKPVRLTLEELES